LAGLSGGMVKGVGALGFFRGHTLNLMRISSSKL
jgi:hypothetical protein